jgi:hypothetical protein
MFAKSRFGVGAALGGVRHSVVSYGTSAVSSSSCVHPCTPHYPDANTDLDASSIFSPTKPISAALNILCL